MGFTTPAFIRKNTANIRNRLRGLGYYCNPYLGWNNLYTYLFGLSSVCSMEDNDMNAMSARMGDIIDCGTNEELFISIAALRDESDIHQWFTDGKEWFQCQYLKVGMHYHDKPEILFEKWHKATVNELIEHFKEEEE